MSRHLVVVALACAWFSAGEPAAAQGPAEGPKPNLVIVLADDLGHGDPQCYQAESKIPTPNVDRLASQGMRFTHAGFRLLAHPVRAAHRPLRLADADEERRARPL